jgi:hypothetical protein
MRRNDVMPTRLSGDTITAIADCKPKMVKHSCTALPVAGAAVPKPGCVCMLKLCV